MMKQPTFLIRALFICLSLILYPAVCVAQSGVLQTSNNWQQPQDALVQKPINLLEERTPSESAPNEVVVKFKRRVSQSTIDAFHSQIGVTVIEVNTSARFMRVRVPAGKTIEQILNLYRKNDDVRYAEPVYYFKAKFVPDDDKYEYQWNLYNPYTFGINVENAWNVTMGSSSVVVAIVDTGVAYESYYDQTNYYYKARDFFGTNFVQGYDFVNNDAHANDDHWHGTFIAGIIAHTTNNNLGGAGVAPETSIMPVKFMDGQGRGSTYLIAEGIIWAADHGANIINLSLGGPEPSMVIQDACDYANKKDVTIVCAAGNRGLNSLVYPAAYNDFCIAVGATRLDGTRAYYSDYGEGLDLVAPGGDVQVDQNRDNIGDGIMAMTFGPKGYNDWTYLFAHGTSMAAAHVSGVAALVIAQGIATTPSEVQQVLQETAMDRGPGGYDIEYGWGQVDAYAAVIYQMPSGTGTSSPADTADTSGSTSGEDTSTGETAEETTGEGTTGTDDIITSGADDSDDGEDTGQEPPPRPTPVLTEEQMEIKSFIPSSTIDKKKKVPPVVRFCECRNYFEWQSPNSAYALADAVFVGRFVKHDFGERPLAKPGSNLTYHWFRHRYHFQVLEQYKGAPQDTIILFYKNECVYIPDWDDSRSVRKGDYGTCVFYKDVCAYPFKRGDTYLIYTKKYGRRHLMANQCMRILPINEADYDLPFLKNL